MNQIFDPIAFFAEAAAQHLVESADMEPREMVCAVFNKAYPYGMTMEEYALKELQKAQRVRDDSEREKKLESLAEYEVVGRIIAGDLGDANDREIETLKKARAQCRKEGLAKQCKEERRPAEGSVVLACRGKRPFTISNVRWATDFVEQKWMHEDSLEALIHRLAGNPPKEHFIIAVAGKPRFSPSHLAFSGRRRFAICHPDRTEYVDIARYCRLQNCFANVRPERRDVFEFRGLCRERGLTAETPKIDERLIRLAGQWQRDATELHDLLLPASNIEIRALTVQREF